MSQNPQKPDKAPKPEMIERLLQNQAKELEFRAQDAQLKREELQIRKQEVQQTHEFALKALTAQVDDVKQLRQQEQRESRYALIIFLVAAGVIGGFLFYALYLNKEQFVLEFVKLLVAAFGGGGVGYAIGIRKTKQPPPTNPDE